MVPPMTSEAEILHEAKMLREHKDRLEGRMRVLEVHNNQLEMQLGKLRTLLTSDGGHGGHGGVGGTGGHPQRMTMTNGNNGMASAGGGHHVLGVIPASITSNKTGTLNTKAVTASQLATNSPVLPHKMNGNGPAPPHTTSKDQNGGGGRGDPPALPPRGVSVRSATGKPPPPAVPPKRSSLTRSDLALFENVS